MDHKILCKSYASDLSAEIRTYLQNGWTLHGSPFACPIGSSSLFCQAVIRPSNPINPTLSTPTRTGLGGSGW